jgi:hypothetical protein
MRRSINAAEARRYTQKGYETQVQHNCWRSVTSARSQSLRHLCTALQLSFSHRTQLGRDSQASASLEDNRHHTDTTKVEVEGGARHTTDAHNSPLNTHSMRSLETPPSAKTPRERQRGKSDEHEVTTMSPSRLHGTLQWHKQGSTPGRHGAPNHLKRYGGPTWQPLV